MSFNGAATWKSRKAVDFAGLQIRDALLQWGRDLEVAERVIEAEILKLGQWRLQWGRDLEVAESTMPGAISLADICFNGAATWKSRKAPSWISYSIVHSSFNGAATWKSRKGVDRGN